MVFPLDLVKTRLQNQVIGPHGERMYKSMQVFNLFKNYQLLDIDIILRIKNENVPINYKKKKKQLRNINLYNLVT